MNVLEENRDGRADQTRNQHCDDEGDADTAGNRKAVVNRHALEERDVDTDADKGEHAENGSVQCSDIDLFENQLQLLFRRELIVHQGANRDSERLGTDISGHVQNQGLEGHDNREARHHAFEESHYGRDDHTEAKEQDKPGQTLLDALLQRLVQIFLRGETCQLCVVLSHLIADHLCDFLRGDCAEDVVVGRKDRNTLLGIIPDNPDAVLDALIGVDIRELCHDDVREFGVPAGND